MKLKHPKLYFIGCVLFCLIFNAFQVMAQSSGGPYGPVQQTYDLPKVTGKVYYVTPDGKPDQQDETLSKPTSIEATIERVKTGNAIVMRGSTYRSGNLILNQGITIQPYADEQHLLKNS